MVLPIQSLLSSFLKSDKDTTDWRTRLAKEWQTIVGDLHTKMRLERIGRDDTIIIGVYDIHWMHELHMLSPLILKTMNEKLGTTALQKIRFVVIDAAAIKKNMQEGADHVVMKKKENASDKKEQLLLSSLTSEQQKALAQVKDPVLQAALARFWKRG